eukprot:6067093-Amphidinium_carterae.1
MLHGQFQNMRVSAAPDEEVASGFLIVADTTNRKPKVLDTDIHGEEHYRNDVIMIEKDARYTSSSGDDTRRRKIKRNDKSWRADAQVRRTNGWDSEWGPSSSCENSEEKYVPYTIKLREAPGFMKRDEEEGFFDKRDMVPVKRTSTAWNMYTKDDAMGVESHIPPRPPPADSNPGHWNSEGKWIEDDMSGPRPPPQNANGPGRWNSDGEWIPGGLKKRPSPPPPPPLPPTSNKEKKAFQVMTKDDHRDYSKLAPNAPTVYDAETSFAESAPLKEYEEFDGHAAIKKGSPCYLRREVTFLSGLAWTYCKAGPPIEGANRTRYELKT